jgi:hypothetical protein
MALPQWREGIPEIEAAGWARNQDPSSFLSHTHAEALGEHVQRGLSQYQFPLASFIHIMSKTSRNVNLSFSYGLFITSGFESVNMG